jgi:hypothetical protein
VKEKPYQLDFDGAVLVRGFWLYVWEVLVNDGRILHYFGKTGDKSSGVSQSPFDRLTKHLGSNRNNNALRRILAKNKVYPEQCHFRFNTCRPFFYTESAKTHSELCDITSSLERALADAMAAAGYVVLNIVKCRIPVDPKLFARVRGAFAAHFKNLGGNA